MLSGTGRKFLRAPRGTGFLYVRRGVLERLEPPFVDLHSALWTSRDEYAWRPDARRFENWETNYSTRVGLAVAVDYALRVGIEDIWERNRRLGALLRERLAAVPRVTVRDQGEVQGAIVTFTVEGHDPVNLRSVSFVEFARLDLEPRGISRMVRASVHYYNTEREVERFVEAVAELAR
jgi:selenocysteine lyase/cysteine desulfurase